MTDIVIIGAGPAGMTAALYALRAGKSVLMLEKESIGGQIASSPKVENWPGTASLSGAELSDGMFEQVTAMGAGFELENVTEIVDNGLTKTVVTEDEKHDCHCVIIASGSKHRHLGLDREEEIAGVSYCAVCDGAFYKGKTVAVVGGGSAALQDAVFLSAGCRKVYLIHRRSEFRGEVSLVETLKNRDNVEFVLDSVPATLHGGDEVTGLTVKNVNTGGERRLDIDGLFVAVGQAPENGAFASVAEMDKAGYIIAGEDCRTKTEGIFAAGDCRTKDVRQLTTAAADGTVSALAACKYIDAKG